MNPIEELLQRKWILKKDNYELYLQVKDSIKEVQKNFQEKFGYAIIVTPQLIKLEKIPGKAEIWMGIQEFQSIKEYQMFCFVLMFLEDKEREEQFVLSSLTEYIQLQFTNGDIDWTNFKCRRQLVRVIKYCLAIHLFELNDGNEDSFVRDSQSEVLYENTGNSHYVLRNFMRDIMEYETPADFEKSDWIDMEEDRGIVRRQRVYRRLLLSPGIYRENVNNEDFQYIRHYRNQISQDFQSLFPCELQVHKSSAFIRLEDDCTINCFFPNNSTMSDLILFICDEIRKKVKRGILKTTSLDLVEIDQNKLLTIINKSLRPIIETLPKKYREYGVEQISKDILIQMNNYGFIETIDDTVVIFPICGKIGGNY